MDGLHEEFTRQPEEKFLPVAEIATVRMVFALAIALRILVL